MVMLSLCLLNFHYHTTVICTDKIRVIAIVCISSNTNVWRSLYKSKLLLIL